MKTLFITISRGSLIRNFFQTDVISKILDKGIRVVCLTPHYEDKEMFQKYVHKNLIFEPLMHGKRYKLDTILTEFNKGVIYSNTVLARYKYRFAGRPPRKIFYYPRVIFFFFFRFFPGIRTIIQKISLVFIPQKQHDYLFEKYKPDMLFITDYMDAADVAVLKSAKRFGVSTAGMPKSWDNLSKKLFRAKSDKIFVWGEFGKKEATTFQEYKEKDIVITGTPQFDYYSQGNIVDRDEFCGNLGLDSDKKIIFYGSTGAHCKNEYEYIDLLLKFIEEERIDAQILIRPHVGYVGDEDKFEKFKDDKRVVVYESKQNLNLRDRWDLSDSHLKDLYNSMYHADICINIASTLTLDSLAVGTPAMNIYFDIKTEGDTDTVLRFYKSDYIGAIAEYGGTWLAKSKEEFYENLKKILIEEKGKKETEREMIEYFLHKIDGHSGDRIVEEIIRYI